LESKNIV
jgi:WD40 repeat protein